MSTKPTSLHKQAETKPTIKAGGIELPAVFQGKPNPIQSRAWAPRVVFAHSKRPDEYKSIQAVDPGVVEGDMYFIHDKTIVPLPYAKFGLFVAKQYWVSKSQAGQVLAVSWTERPDPFREYIEAVLLVYFEDRVTPANVQFRTTKCPIAKQLSDALLEAGEPGWGDKSPAHKESLIHPQPYGRFFGHCFLAEARPSKTSGLPYKPGHCDVKPTTLVEWRLLNEFQENPESAKLLNLCAGLYTSRLKELEPKVVND